MPLLPTDRAAAWAREIRTVHATLSASIDRMLRSLDSGEPATLPADLRSHCLAFCSALQAHHTDEDRALFPSFEAALVARLYEDHAMLGTLLAQLADAAATAPPDALRLHLDGIRAIMTSHFGYEERTLLPRLDALAAGPTSPPQSAS
jgi:hypothetical protein